MHPEQPAERLGERSICGSCRAYGAFKLVGDYPKMNVRCRKCGNEWLLDNWIEIAASTCG